MARATQRRDEYIAQQVEAAQECGRSAAYGVDDSQARQVKLRNRSQQIRVILKHGSEGQKLMLL